MQQSESITKLVEALTKAQSEFTVVPKTKRGQEGNRFFMYADLADVLSMALPKLNKHGIFVNQPLVLDQSGEYLRQTTRLQLGEEFMQSDGIRVKDTEGAGKNLGIAVTYSRRIDFNDFLGIFPDDDVDAPDLTPGTPTPGAKPSFPKQINTPKAAEKAVAKAVSEKPTSPTSPTDFPFGKNTNTAIVGGAAPGGNPEITDDDIPNFDTPITEQEPLTPEAEAAAQAMDAPEPLDQKRYNEIQERLKEIATKKLSGVTTKGLSAYLEARHKGKKLVYVPAVTAENTLKLVEEAVEGGPAKVKELFNSVKENK
jgi:hypothetical protein